MNFNLNMMLDIFKGMNYRLIETENQVQLSLSSVSLFKNDLLKPQADVLIICSRQEYINYFTDSGNASFIIIGFIEPEEFNGLNQQAINIREETTKEAVYIKVLEWLHFFNISNESIRQLLFKSKSIEALTDTKPTAVKNPIALFDAAYQLVEFIDFGIDVSKSQVWRNVLENNAIDLHIYTHQEMKNINQTIQAKESFIIFKKAGMDHLLLPIYYDNKFIGNLSSVAFNGVFEAEEISWLLHITQLINHSFLLQLKNTNQGGIAPQILVQLIQSEDYQQGHLDFFLDQHPWMKNGYLCLYMCELNSNVMLTEDLLGKYIVSLQNEFDKAVIFYYRNRLILLKPRSKSQSKEKSFLRKLDLKVGISNPFNDVTLLNTAYKQAQEALQYGGRKIAAYSDNAFSIVLNLIDSSKQGAVFIYQPFLSLWKNGDDNDRAFLKSVYLFLIHERNLRQASQLLNLHRNSLKYRLEKISEAIEVDLLSESLNPSLILLMIITLHRLIHNEL